MRILGIDPGSRMTGWGILEQNGGDGSYQASGTLKLGAKADLSERLLALANGIDDLLLRFQPEHCALEKIFMGKNAKSALVLGHARGVIISSVARKGISLFEYSPTQVKQAVVGVGRADKNQVNQMVSLLLNRKGPFQEDEADALAVAITHSVFFKQSIRMK